MYLCEWEPEGRCDGHVNDPVVQYKGDTIVQQIVVQTVGRGKPPEPTLHNTQNFNVNMQFSKNLILMQYQREFRKSNHGYPALAQAQLIAVVIESFLVPEGFHVTLSMEDDSFRTVPYARRQPSSNLTSVESFIDFNFSLFRPPANFVHAMAYEKVASSRSNWPSKTRP